MAESCFLAWCWIWPRSGTFEQDCPQGSPILTSKKAADLAVVRQFVQEPAGSFFLFGPRGTGKSTWLRQTHGTAYWPVLNG